jgi:CRP/FNR family transcriptional regulator, cyclic AMP receptor protein
MERDARPQGLLCLLPIEAHRTLDSLESFTPYPPNAVLFQQGEPADRIFILCRGEVKLSMQSDAGDRLPMWIANPGEILGLSACVAGGCYEGTAETVEDAVVAVVPRKRVVDFLRTKQLACLPLLSVLCDQLHIAHEQVRWVASLASSGTTVAQSPDHPNQNRANRNGLVLIRREGASVTGRKANTSDGGKGCSESR